NGKYHRGAYDIDTLADAVRAAKAYALIGSDRQPQQTSCPDGAVRPPGTHHGRSGHNEPERAIAVCPPTDRRRPISHVRLKSAVAESCLRRVRARDWSGRRDHAHVRGG